MLSLLAALIAVLLAHRLAVHTLGTPEQNLHTRLDAQTFRISQIYSVNATVNKRKAQARLYPKATGSALRGGGVTLTLTGG